MVKAVVGEESQLKLAEDRLSQAALPSEVGLVIGKLSKSLDRGFVFDLIPTPQNDAGEPPSSVIESVKDDNEKKGSKGKAQPEFCLWTRIELLNILGRLPICLDKGLSIRKLSKIVRHGLSVHAKMLKGAKGLIHGRLVIEDKQCASDGLHEVEFLLPFMQDKSLEACSQKEVDGLPVFTGAICFFAYLNPKEPISQALDDIKEDIIMSLPSRLDVMCDEADQESESIIESDEGASHHRSSEKHIAELDLQLQRKHCSLSFPRRVFVPWLADTYICDYIQLSETVEVLKDHCVELMSMEAPKGASTILEPESEAPTVIASITQSFWDMADCLSMESNPDNSVSKNNGKARSQGTEQKAARSAVLVLIISIMVGLVLFIFRS